MSQVQLPTLTGKEPFLALTALLGAGSGMDALKEGFASPPPEFSPVPIWWWSGDKIEREGITQQIEKLAQGGIHNAIILNLAPSGPLYGSAADDPPFLTEEWWDLFGYALSECKRFGVRLWFYDQLGFSGAGLQARVVREHPEFRAIDLQRVYQDLDSAGQARLSVPAGGTALAAFVASVPSTGSERPTPQWIWDGGALKAPGTRYFRAEITLKQAPQQASLVITCDNGYALYANGQEVGRELIRGATGWGTGESFDLAALLHAGENVIAVTAENLVGDAGLLLDMSVDDQPALVSGTAFRVSKEAPEGWLLPGFDASGWDPPAIIGGYPCAPWGPIANFRYGQGMMGIKIEDVKDVSAELQGNDLLVDVPEGRRRVMLFYTVPAGFDYQNPDAGAALLDVVHGEMERRFGKELGKGIGGSFQDEFPALPRFSARFLKEFERREGYDLLAKLPALFDEVADRFGEPEGPTTAQIRVAASDVAAELCEKAFFVPLHKWHERHGMLCGYDQTVRNADPIRGEKYYIDYFDTMRHYSAPGSDMDGDAKPHQAMADLYGRPRVWIEAFHSSGWGQTLEEIATLLHPWLLNGATLYNPHAIYYSIHGSYYEWAPPDTGWRQPYFVHNKTFADYTARLCYVLSKGTHIVEAAVLHPSVTVHACSGFGESGMAAQDAGDTYWGVQRALAANYLDYLILDESSLEEAEVIDGELAVGYQRLKTVVLPAARVMKSSGLKVLADFIDHGGQVVLLGAPPEQCADQEAAPEDVERWLEAVKAGGAAAASAEEAAALVANHVQQATAEPMPVLQRQIKNENLYFLLSDTGTAADGNARFAINDRELWKTPAAQGERLLAGFQKDGLPELWDAVSGRIEPLYNYQRSDAGMTVVDVPLSSSPAPLLRLREPRNEDPLEVVSDLRITVLRRSDKTLSAVGVPWNLTEPATEHSLHVSYENMVFGGTQPASGVVEQTLNGPFRCAVEPTCDNSDGSFGWPPSPGPIPVELRVFKYRQESAAESSQDWSGTSLDDSAWETAFASFGPRALWWGPLNLPTGASLESLERPSVPETPGTPAVYSLRLGINEDPVFSNALGGKGRIPEEFIDAGNAEAGAVYLVLAHVLAPQGPDSLPAVLRVGGSAHKRVFLNGEEVRFTAPINSRTLSAGVSLRAGDNVVELLAARESGGPMRLFYQFLPPGDVMPYPEWIWSNAAPASGQTEFTKSVDIPGEVASAGMVVALGDLHQIFVNDQLIADQGNFDPYFTSRAEHYDLSNVLQPGENIIKVVARDSSGPTGMQLDGCAWLKDGGSVVFVSDTGFLSRASDQTAAAGETARILPGPSHGYMGDPALLMLQPRPHPLPLAGWLVNQAPPPAPFDALVFAADTVQPPAQWFRFKLPPGATEMTLPTRGAVQAWVNGTPAQTAQVEGGWRVHLAEQDAPARTAAVRVEVSAGSTAGAAFDTPITFAMGEGMIPVGSWDELGLPHYSGGLVYKADLSLDKALPYALLDLGHVRGTAEVKVNGKACGVRLWHPYQFDLSQALQTGNNTIEIRVFNTLGPHFAEGHPSQHVYKNHTKSGIFGPIALRMTTPTEFKLEAE